MRLRVCSKVAFQKLLNDFSLHFTLEKFNKQLIKTFHLWLRTVNNNEQFM
jgi:hypothetical protein